MELGRLSPDDPALKDVLILIQTCFAYMDGIIDPPSSIHSLTLQSLQAQIQTGEIWSLGPPLSACAFLTPKPDSLYIGKLCVAPHAQRQGLARQMIDFASERARQLNLNRLDLQTRVELTANHSTFRALGFTEIRRTTHAGFTSPTSITFAKTL